MGQKKAQEGKAGSPKTSEEGPGREGRLTQDVRRRPRKGREAHPRPATHAQHVCMQVHVRDARACWPSKLSSTYVVYTYARRACMHAYAHAYACAYHAYLQRIMRIYIRTYAHVYIRAYIRAGAG